MIFFFKITYGLVSDQYEIYFGFGAHAFDGPIARIVLNRNVIQCCPRFVRDVLGHSVAAIGISECKVNRVL